MALKVAQVATLAYSLTPHLRGWFRYLVDHGYEVHTISSPGEQLHMLRVREGVAAVHEIPIPRHADPPADARAFWRFYRLFQRERYDIVHACSPKAGFLALVAARLTGVPVRIFSFRGTPHLTATGLMRALLWGTEWLTVRLAHRVVCNSASLRAELARRGILAVEQVDVIGQGSSNGVDATRFRRCVLPGASPLRRAWNVAADGRVVGYVGRFARDKGVADLAAAWSRVRERDPHAYLVLVGRRDEREPVAQRVLARLQRDPRVRLCGWCAEPARVYEALDVLVLPTYREGFSNVLLEASAVGVPVVASNAVGARDVVIDGVTGLLVPVRRPDTLAGAIVRLLADPAERARMGRAGRERAERDFQPGTIWAGMLKIYAEALAATGHAPARAAVTAAAK
jgi:glycosyltransferase involved in cell wall biosynthesis